MFLYLNLDLELDGGECPASHYSHLTSISHWIWGFVTNKDKKLFWKFFHTVSTVGKFWFQELEADNFVFTSGMFAQLLELYAYHNKLEEVQNIMKILQERDPDFVIDNMKIIKIVALLIKNDKIPGKVYSCNQFFVYHFHL